MNPTRWYAGVLAFLALLTWTPSSRWGKRAYGPPVFGRAAPDAATQSGKFNFPQRRPFAVVSPNGPDEYGEFGPGNSPSGTGGWAEALASGASYIIGYGNFAQNITINTLGVTVEITGTLTGNLTFQPPATGPTSTTGETIPYGSTVRINQGIVGNVTMSGNYNEFWTPMMVGTFTDRGCNTCIITIKSLVVPSGADGIAIDLYQTIQNVNSNIYNVNWIAGFQYGGKNGIHIWLSQVTASNNATIQGCTFNCPDIEYMTNAAVLLDATNEAASPGQPSITYNTFNLGLDGGSTPTTVYGILLISSANNSAFPGRPECNLFVCNSIVGIASTGVGIKEQNRAANNYFIVNGAIAGASGYSPFQTSNWSTIWANGGIAALNSYAGPGLSVSPPTLPAGTGSGNAVVNPRTLPAFVYMSGAVGVHLIDANANDSGNLGNLTLVRVPSGYSVYFATTVPLSWVWDWNVG